MKTLSLNRRSVLKGAAGVAVALPWLEAMTSERTAGATEPGSTPKRFLAVYWPGGTVPEKWRPSGTEEAFTLSPILSPFEDVKSSLLIPDGLYLMAGDHTKFLADQSQGGSMGWLTGQVQPSANAFVNGPSIDQVLAPRLSADKAFASLGMAVRWGTGKSQGSLHPMNVCQFEAASPFPPIPPQIDPVSIWKTLFDDPSRPNTERAWETSILDALDKRYATLAQRLGAADRQRLEAHLERIRDLEKRIGSTAVSGECVTPTLVDTSDYDPAAGLQADDNGAIRDLDTDAAIPKVGKLMMDMIAMAFACDKTGVALLQWSDTQAMYTLPWLDLPETHYFYQNGGGYRPAECEKIYTWYSSQHAYLLQQLAAIDMGGHSLLDETVVFFGTEVSHPATHSKLNMPFLLAGGGLRTGRWVQYLDNPPHNNLLVSLLNLFGNPSTTFGDARCCTGALPNLV
jgi:hypothetical protein